MDSDSAAPRIAPRPRAADGIDGARIELVSLERDHPGFNDQLYRRRRDEIAALAGAWREGEALPSVEYKAVEHEIWRAVWGELEPLHARLACRPYLEGRERFDFSHERIPSFAEVNRRLEGLEGFHLAPVAGLVTPATFLRQLGRRRFLATQYMRHHSTPLYTPEPDVVHEYIGHVPSLAHPQLAELNAAFGEASANLDDDSEAVEQMIRVYWYTIEFGLVAEGEAVKVFGAGTLSSFGELQHFSERAELRPWALEEMAHTDFDPTHYQARMFVAPSFARLRDDLLRWLESL